MEKKALNPYHILIQAIPKRQLSSKEKGLGRILDRLIFRYRGVSLITSNTIKLEQEPKELEACPISPIVTGPDFLVFLSKPVLSFRPFRDPAHPRLAMPKNHG